MIAPPGKLLADVGRIQSSMLSQNRRRCLLLCMRSIFIGFLLAVLTIVIIVIFEKSQGFTLLSLLLAFIAAVYLGFAFADGSRKAILLESFVAEVFLFIASLGLFVSPLVLVGGYLVHDLELHHAS